jgi:hypothetical protein
MAPKRFRINGVPLDTRRLTFMPGSFSHGSPAAATVAPRAPDPDSVLNASAAERVAGAVPREHRTNAVVEGLRGACESHNILRLTIDFL